MPIHVLEKDKKIELYQKNFEALISQMIEIFHLSPTESEKLRKNKIVNIVGKLPFLANCNYPERTALSHLAITYIASHKAGKDLFLHGLADNADLFKRLERINHFDGGDKNTIKMGMNQLAIIMLNDHMVDSELDQKKDKYNPLNSMAWDYQNILQNLIEENERLFIDGAVAIYTTEDIRHAFWEIP